MRDLEASDSGWVTLFKYISAITVLNVLLDLAYPSSNHRRRCSEGNSQLNRAWTHTSKNACFTLNPQDDTDLNVILSV